MGVLGTAQRFHQEDEPQSDAENAEQDAYGARDRAEARKSQTVTPFLLKYEIDANAHDAATADEPNSPSMRL